MIWALKLDQVRRIRPFRVSDKKFFTNFAEAEDPIKITKNDEDCASFWIDCACCSWLYSEYGSQPHIIEIVPKRF